MLQVNNIRENKDAYVKALSKRGIDANTILEEVLQVDETRRNTQAQLDEVLSQSNTLSKEIGMLFQKGEAQKANELKEQTTQLKEQSKTLQDQLNEASEKLQQLLFTIPNIPNELVPAGQDENDNEEVYKEGDIPTLDSEALPHWELAKKYDLIDFELGVKELIKGYSSLSFRKYRNS